MRYFSLKNMRRFIGISNPVRSMLVFSGILAAVVIINGLHCLTGPEPGEHWWPHDIDPSDSANLRSILDENGLDSVSVRSAGLFNYRLISFQLDSILISKFNFSTKFRQFDSIYSISLTNMGLDSISVSDSFSFKKKTQMIFNENKFTNFPTDILKIKNILYVYFQKNYLSEIPMEVLENNYQGFYVGRNNLCNVPDTIANWLTQFDHYWQNTQNCQ
jgi:hypothetical protein